MNVLEKLQELTEAQGGAFHSRQALALAQVLQELSDRLAALETLLSPESTTKAWSSEPSATGDRQFRVIRESAYQKLHPDEVLL